MRTLVKTLAATLLLSPLACDAPEDRSVPADRAADARGLSAFAAEHGLGPFTSEVTLGPIDRELAAEGERIYQMNCESCHRMQDRFVGPPLGDLLERRSPAFVLNMILNPEQMAREHPEVQAMVREYHLIMPFQNITEEQAFAILEYLRTVQR